MAGTIRHEDIPQLFLHEPKEHAITEHDPSEVVDHGLFVRANLTTGAIEFSAVKEGFPPFAGDPPSPVNGETWYDTVNGRFRGKTPLGKVTFNLTLDP